MIAKINRKPTIATVATKAKVAPMTVSRVLNGGYVSADVRTRVERVIKELGYVPSPTARSLKYGRRGCIGVAVESVHGAWFMGLFGGIEEELAKKHVSVMLGGLRQRDKYDQSTVSSWISEHRVDGIIFARYTRSERPLLEAAQAAQIPVTFICPDETLNAGYVVRCRNFDAGRMLGDHLLELGHRRIGFVGGPKDSVDSVDRQRGLRAAVEAVEGAQLRAEDTSFRASYMPAEGAEAALEFLRRPAAQRPTAVVMGNDSMALAFLRELLRAGLSVPDDVSVGGFDGVDEGERFWPSLTTVTQPMHTLGASACRALLERVDNPQIDEAMTVEYPMELVVRESSGKGPLLRKKRK
jgi:LacI family transcriptional regulator